MGKSIIFSFVVFPLLLLALEEIEAEGSSDRNFDKGSDNYVYMIEDAPRDIKYTVSEEEKTKFEVTESVRHQPSKGLTPLYMIKNDEKEDKHEDGIFLITFPLLSRLVDDANEEHVNDSQNEDITDSKQSSVSQKVYLVSGPDFISLSEDLNNAHAELIENAHSETIDQKQERSFDNYQIPERRPNFFSDIGPAPLFDEYYGYGLQPLLPTDSQQQMTQLSYAKENGQCAEGRVTCEECLSDLNCYYCADLEACISFGEHSKENPYFTICPLTSVYALKLCAVSSGLTLAITFFALVGTTLAFIFFIILKKIFTYRKNKKSESEESFPY